jgi:hypothetical protein
LPLIATDSGTLDWTSPNLPQVLGKRLPEGRNPQLRCIASYVFDGLEACNKPLVYYLYMQTLEGIIWCV